MDLYRWAVRLNGHLQIGIRLKSTGSGFPDPRLFTSVLPYLDSFLRQQHEQFVCSEEFLEAFNRVGTYPFIDLCRSCVGLLGLAYFLPKPFHSPIFMQYTQYWRLFYIRWIWVAMTPQTIQLNDDVLVRARKSRSLQLRRWWSPDTIGNMFWEKGGSVYSYLIRLILFALRTLRTEVSQ